MGASTGAVGLSAIVFATIYGEVNGYRSALVIVLFIAGITLLVGFIRAERHVRAPMLDLAYFRSPPFSGALVVVFVLFFGVFSIFFFTALYLAAVVGYSAFRIALEFLPMTAAMVLASGLAGGRVAMAGPRASMAEGCVMAGAGVLLSEVLLSSPSRPSAWLVLTLALAGFGFGTSVVPVTAVVLGEVRPERSGMAASATNTSRELGAVFGVAVLGALVNSHLTRDLTHRLQAIHALPRGYFGIIINAIETGLVPKGVRGGGSIENRVIEAAYGAFRDGLDVALLTSGIAMLAAAVVAAATLRGKGVPAAPAATRP